MLQTPFGLSALTYADRRLPGRAACRTPCSAPRGGSRWPPRPRRASSVSSCTACSGRSLGEDLRRRASSSRSALIVGLLNTVAAPLVVRAMRWATGSVEQRARPGGVPVIAESPRVRMSVLGIVVFALFAVPVRPPLLPAGDGHRRVPGGGPGEPDPRRAGRGAARPHPRPQRQGPRRQPDLGAGHHRPHACSTSSRTTSAPGPHRAGRGAGARRATRRPSRSSRPTSPNQRYSPYVPVPGRRRRARGAEDLDRRARRASSPASPPSGSPVRRYPYGQLAAHVLGYTGQIIDDEFEDARRARRSRTRSTTRSGSTASRRSTRTTCAARPARGRSRSTPRTSRSASVERGPRRSRATTSSSTSTSTCRPQAEQALQSGLAHRQGPPVHRLPVAPRRPRRAPRSCSTRRPAA